MKRSRHGDYVNGYVAKTGHKSSMHCVLNQIWNWFKVYRFKLEDFNCVTSGKQHNSRYNCIYVKKKIEDTKKTLPKKKTQRQFYINKCMNFTVFKCGSLNFHTDSWIWKVRSPTGKLVANAEKIMQVYPAEG